MKVLKASIHPLPNLRFRTEEDAMKAMEFVKRRQPIDPSLIVWPYKLVGDNVIVDKDYIDAPYELSLVEFELADNRVVDCKQSNDPK